MSWSVSAVGKPKVVATSIERQLGSHKCQEPEESIRQDARRMIAASLAAMPENVAVKVTASGSMDFNNGIGGANNVTVAVDRIYGFVE